MAQPPYIGHDSRSNPGWSIVGVLSTKRLKILENGKILGLT